MVKYEDRRLDETFSALSDPTRRALIARLAGQPSLSVSELARPLPISLPGVMKHLDALAKAGLIVREKKGRTVSCRLETAPMVEVMAWLTKYERFWTESLDRLATFVEHDT